MPVIVYIAAGIGGLSAATWRVAVVVAWRRNSHEYLSLCRDVWNRQRTTDVLTHAAKVLQPPTLVPVIRRREAARSPTTGTAEP